MVSPVSNLDISHGTETFPLAYDNSSSAGFSLRDSFQYVKTNVPGPGFDKETFSEQFAGCDCTAVCTTNTCSCLQLFGSSYDERGKLKIGALREQSPRPVLECGHACSCDPTGCVNRTVQQGIKNTLYIFHANDKGYGLMLDKNNSEISSLSFVCEYAGEVIGDAEARKRMKETDITGQANYLISLREHVSGAETCTYIDPRYIGNVGRFINHSCDPNLLMVPVRVNHQVPRLALFARKNIKPGEELTFDYSGIASLKVFSDSIPEVSPVSSQTCPPHSETLYSSCNISLDRTNMDKMAAQNSQPSASDFAPPRKIIKIYQTGCSKFTSVCITEKDSLIPAKSNSPGDKRKDKVTDYEIVESENKSMFEVSDSNTSTSASVKRKPCFCGSTNCTGFLPMDNMLLCD